MDPVAHDGALFLLIGAIALALVVSFLCSVAEAVLLSITPSYIAGQRRKKPRWGALLHRLRFERVDRSLAAILTMNTIAHTIGAIEAGAQSAVVFGSRWVGLFSAVMTLAILFASEIIPKTLGTVHWRRLVGVTVLYIRGLIAILYPLVLTAEGVTRLVSRGRSARLFSRDEFVAMAGLGEQTGELDLQESRIIHNLFRFRHLKATDIMTPRTVIAALPERSGLAVARARVTGSPFSRFLLFGTDLDDITGFALKEDILSLCGEGGEGGTLEAFRREVHAVPDSISLPRLLEFLMNHHAQIALVVDEFGGTRGVVTMEDLVETLIGLEIVDEMDDVADMQELARAQWRRRMETLGIEVSGESWSDTGSR